MGIGSLDQMIYLFLPNPAKMHITDGCGLKGLLMGIAIDLGAASIIIVTMKNTLFKGEYVRASEQFSIPACTI